MTKEIDTDKKSTWTFMTNHSHVLLCLAINSTMLAREIAVEVSITERAVLRILKELVDDKYVSVVKKGRCNTYSIDENKYLKHPIEAHCKIGAVLNLLKK
jgi:predicted transcriptional regulator